MKIQANQNQVIQIAVNGGEIQFISYEGHDKISIVQNGGNGWNNAGCVSVEEANQAIEKMFASGGKVVPAS